MAMNKKEVTKKVDEFVDTVCGICSRDAHIVMANGEDLLEMDMSRFSQETFFISDMTIERGTLKIVKDEEMKKKLYKFCIEHEDRVFRGTKEKEYGT